MTNESVVVEMADGRVEECVNEQEAREFVERQFGDVVYCDQWDANGFNDDNQQMERLLFWADDTAAENDAGANALGYLSRIGD
jgi:hypothetical protein